MSEALFAGAFGGDGAKLAADTRLECKICWYIYDPKLGDVVWQIPAGTAFAGLPEHWSCPECGGKKQDFLLLDD